VSGSPNWYVGDPWVQTWTLTDPDTGAAIDPSSVVVKVFSPKERAEPAATGKPLTVTKTGAGVYRAVQKAMMEAGDWEAHIECSGTIEGVKPKRIHVNPLRSS
jgi:hypothetical protein